MSLDPTAVTQPSDPGLTLIRAMAAGSSKALDALYQRYGSALLSFLTARLGDRQWAEEILQDVMLAAWDHAASFRGESSVYTWLLTIARNRALNATRRHSLPANPIDDHIDIQSGDTGVQEKVEREADKLVVRKAINQLPPHFREVLVLVFYNQLSGAEVASVLGVNLGTVKSRLNRAKAALREALIKEGRAVGA